MKVRTIGVLSFVGLAMSAGPIWAGPVGVQRNLSPDQETAAVAQLETQRDQVARAMQVPPENKGPVLQAERPDKSAPERTGGGARRDRPGSAANAPLIASGRRNQTLVDRRVSNRRSVNASCCTGRSR